jgi:hypothetical protein
MTTTKEKPMSKQIFDHLRSNVIGYLALFLTLTMGTAYATHKNGANTISSIDVIDGEVKTPDLAANAVTGDKVLNRSINFGDIAADAISSGHIATGSILSSDVRNNDLSGFDIADTNSLTGAEIAESGLTAGGDLSGSLANAQLAASSVDSSEIADSAVQAPDIATASVNTDELAPSSVDGQKISDDAVEKEDIKSGAVESSEIADDAVKAEEIGTAAVDSTEIAPNAVGTSDIGNIPAVVVVGGSDTDVPDSTRTLINFDMEIQDTGNLLPGAGGTHFIAPVDGIYSINASLYWQLDDTPSGYRETAIVCEQCEVPFFGRSSAFLAHLRTRAEGPGGGVPSNGCGPCQGFVEPDQQPGSLSTIAKLRAGDTIGVAVWQNSGEPQKIRGFLGTADPARPMISPSLSMTWIAPAS